KSRGGLLAKYGQRLQETVQRLSRPPVLRPPRSVTTLEEAREEMKDARLHAMNHRGIYLDDGPTGIGKSHADIHTAKRLDGEGKRSLTMVPTHQQCRQTVEERGRQGVGSTAYPQLSQETCARYDEAIHVQTLGLSFVEALCSE